MTRHYRLAFTSGVTIAALVAAVSLGFFSGFMAAQLPPASRWASLP